MANLEYYQSWSEEEHGSHLGTWDRHSPSRIVRLLDEFNEWHLFRTLVGQPNCHTFSDVGCATGHVYPYLQKVWPSLEYKGFDISKSAIQHAQELYPKADFQWFDGQVKSSPEVESDIVFCRDVVHHQTNPVEMLHDLYETTKKHLILRMRTKEVGETIFDPERSCQYAYGHWVPFIIFNTSELVDLLGSMDPKPARIIVRIHPTVLGGVYRRFVPKEMYYPETGTAETALLVEKGTVGGNTETEVSIEVCPETKYSAPWVRPLKGLAHRMGL